MKTQVFSRITLCLVLALACGGASPLRAQEETPAPDKPETEESRGPESGDGKEGGDAEGEDQPELTPEEIEERLKKAEEREKELVRKMMRVFLPLEGEWIGKEELKFEDKRFKDKTWKDEWKGYFTMNGRYFEMEGKTSEGNESAYRWICTYDPSVERYRAWYFGDNATNQYIGTLSEDGTHVVWRSRGESGSISEFTMKAVGNRVRCHGTDRLANRKLFSTQSSEYTRKSVDI